MNGRSSPLLTACAVAGLALPSAAAFAVDAAGQTFTGYARDLKTRQLLYIESHFVRAAGTGAEARVVLYRCARGGQPFGRKELSYPQQRQAPEFSYVDGRDGSVEGLKRTPQGLRVFQRAGRDAPVREAPVPPNVAIVSDAGFDEFVRAHWAELASGATVRFPFLVPSRLDFITFKVHKDRQESIEGAPVSVIRLNLSGPLGWFLPYIEVSYRNADRVLMRYKGLTNIRDVTGQNIIAEIDFPAAERVTVPSETVNLEAQKALPLANRCPVAN